MELLGLIDTIDFEQLSIEQLTYLNQLKGEILTLLGKFEDAKLAFVIAQESAIKVKNANVQAEALSALADISLKQGSLDGFDNAQRRIGNFYCQERCYRRC